MERVARLQKIYDDAGRQGAQAFRFAVRRVGLQISDAAAKALVAQQATGQIFQGRIPSDGVVPGGGKDDMRWQMDLIDGSERIERPPLRTCSSKSLLQDHIHATYEI